MVDIDIRRAPRALRKDLQAALKGVKGGVKGRLEAIIRFEDALEHGSKITQERAALRAWRRAIEVAVWG